MSYIKSFFLNFPLPHAYFAMVVTTLLLGPILMPGYLLLLDMPWAPHMQLEWDTYGINNFLPLRELYVGLSYVLPSDEVQKILLFAVLFLIVYLPLKFMPFIENAAARYMAALLYTLNPFVYERFLTGQWLVLLGYACLPMILGLYVRIIQAPTRRNAIFLGLGLAAMGICSVHYLYLSLVLILISTTVLWFTDRREQAVEIGLAIAGALALSAWWIVPALLRSAPTEALFSDADFRAFTSSGIGEIPVWLNLLMLGGFWAEGQGWSLYFAWPQLHWWFWVSASCIGALILLGVYIFSHTREWRVWLYAAIAVAVFAYICALGVSLPYVQDINYFLYHHVPLWPGLRDSQKFIALVAVLYALFFGIAIEGLLRSFDSVRLRRSCIVLVLVVVVFTGRYQWWGWGMQLEPVQYPDSWYQTRAELLRHPGARVLVLPWHGYLSLDFNNQLLVANPTSGFFAPVRIVAGQSIDVGSLHDETSDPYYRALDTVLSAPQTPTGVALRDALDTAGITHVLMITNKLPGAFVNWTDRPDAAVMVSTLGTSQLYTDLHLVEVIPTR